MPVSARALSAALLQHGRQLEARAEAQHRRAQRGDALGQDLDLALKLFAALQLSPSRFAAGGA